MKCNMCGSELEPGARVCKYCGNVIDLPQPNFTPDPDLFSGADPAVQEEHRGEVSEEDTAEPLTRKIPKNSPVSEPKEPEDEPEEGEDTMSRQPSNKKKKHPVRTVILMVLAMMALFAITFTIFFRLLGGSFSSGEEATETPAATLPVVSTQAAVPTEKPTEKVSTVEKVKEKAGSAIKSVTEKKTEEPKKTQEPEPEPVEEEPAEETKISDYLFESNRYVIRQTELEARSREEIKHIYYEIYARHGYEFQDEELNAFFSQRSWYHPETSHREAAESQFNVVERENIEVIEKYQREQGWRQ